MPFLTLQPVEIEAKPRIIALYYCDKCDTWFFRWPAWDGRLNHFSPSRGKNFGQTTACKGPAYRTRDKTLRSALLVGGEEAARGILDACGVWREG